MSACSVAPALDASLSASVTDNSDGLHLRGEVSGLGPGTSEGDHVDYLSPFTLHMRLEKLLLEHGEECLTRDWARVHQPELYWNLVWFTTRLSIPFPILLDSLDPVLADTAVANFRSPECERKKKTLQLLNSCGIFRQDSMERLGMLFFHEVVVVGWEGDVVRNRCEKVEVMLKQRLLKPPPNRSSSNVAAGNSAITYQRWSPVYPRVLCLCPFGFSRKRDIAAAVCRLGGSSKQPS